MNDAATLADPRADKVEIENLIKVCYEMVSGPAGPRDWSRQDEIFHPDCRQIRTGVDESGQPWMRTFSLDEYRADADAKLATMDFYEIALVNRIEVFGNIAQAWSSYEAKTRPGDAPSERRGINAFHFYKGPNGRWQIIAMIWDNERDGLRLPADMTGF
ncbi:hypothetical protein [uncultured Maricaulis sp.]|uniref:hypothetical protein n=1 Tax=uncultured Maricaulis sp. TaxID=174710 RepID=UPI0026238D71|nr:hypothetical protein [uncultured Maricaulis sp.]